MHSLAEDAGRGLDVLSETGVTDAELRRLYGCDPEADLATAVRDELGDDRTRALLRALEATGRSFELEARVTEDVSDPLARVLDRYGYSVEVSADGHELDVVAFDAVTNDIHRFRTIAESGPFQETLESALLHPVGLTTVDLVDGSILVADKRAIARLQARYGERIEPYGEPLLRSAPDDIGEPVTTGESATGASSGGPASADSGAPSGAAGGESAGLEQSAESADVERSTDTDDGTLGSISDALENGKALSDEERAEATRAATTADSEPRRKPESNSEPEPTFDDLEVGGGPRTSVSSGSIDDIFDDLETTARSSTGGDDSTLAGGGPKKTVSSGSVDEIIEQARGDADFDEIAAREAEADPDAILDEDDDAFLEGSQADAEEGNS